VRVLLRHRTDYRYSAPVQLGSHLLRLTPHASNVRVLAHAITVWPLPWTRQAQLDAFGNQVTRLEFSGSTRQLTIDSQVEVDTLVPNTLLDNMRLLPWFANASSITRTHDELARYRSELAPDAKVQHFAAGLAARVGQRVLPFLDLLNETLYTRTRQQTRASGDAQPAAFTLAHASGSCRDVAVLFMAACRSLGIASRFTSGYSAPLDRGEVSRDLHAWPEVFLPGFGWRGWDPAQGQRVSNAHVGLCSAPTQPETLPVQGGYSFSGSTVDITLDCELRIST
jgi:transglutaminase-like putative cysteine protease